MMFNEVLEKEYSDMKFAKGHQYTVDAYACQHIGRKEDKRAINSVNIHLASMYLLFVEKVNLADIPKFRQAFAQFYKESNTLEWLLPPESYSELTVFEVWDNENADSHYELTKRWAESVWESWSHQHATIESLVHQSGVLSNTRITMHP
ncbi:MAG: hypothetical protein Tsb0034_26600 [Ekhidna sp.]